MERNSYEQYTLAELIRITDAFLAFAATVNRPLTAREHVVNRWIITAWEKSPAARDVVVTKDESLQITIRLARLRHLFYPDPIRVLRIMCDHDDVKSVGSSKIVLEPLAGVRNRRMTEDEAGERLALLRESVRNMRFLMKEIMLYHRAKHEIGNISKALRKFNLLGKELAQALDKHRPKMSFKEDRDSKRKVALP